MSETASPIGQGSGKIVRGRERNRRGGVSDQESKQATRIKLEPAGR